ncbi:MAG: dockerin type I repeat-containing protein [Clostridia bacterium]|nr:dockerin type I repeat-containing protein [Clostridia bacterium]
MKKILSLIIASSMLASMTAMTTAFADEARLTGDVTGDAKVSMEDVTETQKYVAKLVEFDDEQLKAADVDGNGDVNMEDIVTVQRKIANLIDKFPADDVTDTETDVDSESDTDVTSDTDSASDTDETSDTDTTSEGDTSVVLNLKEAREKGEGVNLRLKGQVVYIYGNNTVILEDIIDDVVVCYQIYDGDGVSAGKYPMNAIVEVEGTTTSYNTALQIKNPTDVKTVSTDNAPIAPVEATVAQLSNRISTKVVIKKATLAIVDDQNMTITDATGSVNLFRPAALPDGYEAGMTVDVVCCPYMYNGAVQVRNMGSEDYILSTGSSDSSDSDGDTNTDTSSETDIRLDDAVATLYTYLKSIENYGDLSEDAANTYTSESYEPFIELVEKAEAIVNAYGEGYTADQVVDITNKLVEAWNNLEESAIGMLERMVGLIDSYGDNVNDNGFYTNDSFGAFMTIYNQAKAVLADPSSLSSEQIEELAEELYNFWVEGLELTSIGTIYTIVNEALYYYPDNNDGMFTDASYNAFAALVNQGLEYLEGKITLTSGQVDSLANDLQAAYENLEYSKDYLLEVVDYYIESFASVYAEHKDDGSNSDFYEWKYIYEELLDISDDISVYDTAEIEQVINDFYEYSEVLGLLGGH